MKLCRNNYQIVSMNAHTVDWSWIGTTTLQSDIKKAAVALRGGVVDSITPETLERERSAEPCKTRWGGNYNEPRPSVAG